MHPRTRALLAASVLLSANQLAAEFTPTAIQEWWETHGDYQIKNLASGIQQKPADFPLDLPEENPLNIPDYTLLNEFRPEFSLSFENAFFEVKPRFVAKREYFRSGKYDGREKSDTDTYIHEWVAQFFLTTDLSISYVREDLQWGPSFLLSPSNPFDSNNGRREPKSEVEAADYAKLTWTPHQQWTFTAMVSTDDGRKEYRVRKELRQDFKDIYAFKADYIFDRGSASLIASTTDASQDEDTRLGYYATYNVTDALISYLEGSVSEDDSEFLIGNTYTLQSGLSISAEYFYNTSGFHEDIPSDPIDLVELEDDILSFPNRESFIHRNYGLLQVYQNDVYRSLDLLMRLTYNLDDSSRSLLGHAEFDINDNAIFFASGTINSNGQGELDSLREYWIQAGIELSF